jgi:hypothetical protein
MGSPTAICVKVKTKDAKFLGSSLGGALVTIRDTLTDELLSQGYTSGSTGDTQTIMHNPGTRRSVLSDESSARFETSLELDRPRQLTVTAFGPMGQQHSANSASSSQWVVPGRHVIGGDAWLLEIPGFAVHVFEPLAHASFAVNDPNLRISAHVIMM